MAINHGQILSAVKTGTTAMRAFWLFLPIEFLYFRQNLRFENPVTIIKEKIHNGKKKMGREMQDITKLKINLEILYLIGYNRKRGCGSYHI
ncbi:MAG: hypothetical protein HFI31_01055 [Lachnospiraceae bacterium]|jgi:hypothetical protein|nr:hypothetical protein [Lachnospiraceae bacterium]MCI8995163.1 hypothetical protein [Lachnospiraceae bacterium]MCI9132765.1 hypothetical protein [Lachnospiraceae bacterium]